MVLVGDAIVRGAWYWVLDSDAFFFARMQPIYTMAMYIFVRFSRPLSARWWHIAISPLPFSQACPK